MYLQLKLAKFDHLKTKILTKRLGDEKNVEKGKKVKVEEKFIIYLCI